MLASTLAACGGGGQGADADESDDQNSSEVDDGKVSIGEINADNVEGMCEQVFGSTDDVYTKLDIADGITDFGDWGDEYFPRDGTEPSTFRCQAHARFEAESGWDGSRNVDISVAAGDSDPRGSTDFTVSAEGLTGGLQSSDSVGSGMQEKTSDEIVEQSVGEQFLTDEALPKFKP